MNHWIFLALWPSIDLIERKPGDEFDPLFSDSYEKEEEEMTDEEKEGLAKRKRVNTTPPPFIVLCNNCFCYRLALPSTPESRLEYTLQINQYSYSSPTQHLQKKI